jgi:GNAT superfamily N-acetyltransferase
MDEKIRYEIKKSDINDAEEILRLQYEAFHSEAVLYNNFSIQPLTQTLAEKQAEYDRSVILKAEITDAPGGKKIVGSVSAREEGETVFIGKLIVLPEYQNMGIGGKLLLAAGEVFPGKRCELYTGGKSEKNLALYEKAGYRRFMEKEESPGLTFVYLEK